MLSCSSVKIIGFPILWTVVKFVLWLTEGKESKDRQTIISKQKQKSK